MIRNFLFPLVMVRTYIVMGESKIEHVCETKQSEIMEYRSQRYFILERQEECGFGWANGQIACEEFVDGHLAILDDEDIDELARSRLQHSSICFWISANEENNRLVWKKYENGIEFTIRDEPVKLHSWNPSREVRSFDCGYMCPVDWSIQTANCGSEMTSILCTKEAEKDIALTPAPIPSTASVRMSTTPMTTEATTLTLTTTTASTTAITQMTTEGTTLTLTTTTASTTTVTQTPTARPPKQKPKPINRARNRVYHNVWKLGDVPHPRLNAAPDSSFQVDDSSQCVRSCNESCEAINYGSLERVCSIYHDFESAKIQGAVFRKGWFLWVCQI